MNNWTIISVIAIIIVLIILFVLIKNKKDEKQFEEQLKQDYHKPKMHDVETDNEESI